MSQHPGLIVDTRGKPLLACARCGGGLTDEDIYVQGLRLPDHGETAGEYLEAELIDALEHVDCSLVRPAG